MKLLKCFALLIVVFTAIGCGGETLEEKAIEVGNPSPVPLEDLNMYMQSDDGLVYALKTDKNGNGVVESYNKDNELVESVPVVVTKDENGNFSVTVTFSDGTVVEIYGRVDENGNVTEVKVKINGVEITVSISADLPTKDVNIVINVGGGNANVDNGGDTDLGGGENGSDDVVCPPLSSFSYVKLNVGDNYKIVWDGQEYGVFYVKEENSDYKLYFMRMSEDGVPLDEGVMIESTLSSGEAPSVVSTKQDYALVWTDKRNGKDDIYFSRVSFKGEPITGDIRLTDDTQSGKTPSLAITGYAPSYSFGLAFVGNTSAGNENIIYLSLQNTGKVIAKKIITDRSGPSKNPSIASGSKGYDIVWEDYRGSVNGEPQSEIYLRQVTSFGNFIDGRNEMNVSKDFYNSTDPVILSKGVIVWKELDGAHSAVLYDDGTLHAMDTKPKVSNYLYANPIKEDVTQYYAHYVFAGYGDYAGEYPDQLNLFRYNYGRLQIGKQTPIVDPAVGKVVDPTVVKGGNSFGVTVKWPVNNNCGGTYFVKVDEPGYGFAPIKLAEYEENPGDGYTYYFYPKLVWNGSGYGAAWLQGGEPSKIWFVRLDADGNKLGEPVEVKDAGGYTDRMASFNFIWTGKEYVFAWVDLRSQTSGGYFGEPNIYMARFDESGVKIGADKAITHRTDYTDYLSFSMIDYGYGYFFAYVFSEETENLYFLRTDYEGNPRENPKILVHKDIVSPVKSVSIQWPTMARGSWGYGIAWDVYTTYSDGTPSESSLGFAVLDVSGNPATGIKEIENHDSGTIHAYNNGYAFLASSGVDLYLTRFASDGSYYLDTYVGSTSTDTNIEWDGESFMFIGQPDGLFEGKDPQGGEYACHLDSDGKVITNPIRIADWDYPYSNWYLLSSALACSEENCASLTVVMKDLVYDIYFTDLGK